jgi:hypothetical protein
VESASGALLDEWTNPVTGVPVGIRMPDKPDSNPLKGNGLDPIVPPWVRNGDSAGILVRLR